MKFICNDCGSENKGIKADDFVYFQLEKVDLNRRFGIPYDNRLRFIVKCKNCDAEILFHAELKVQELIKKGIGTLQ